MKPLRILERTRSAEPPPAASDGADPRRHLPHGLGPALSRGGAGPPRHRRRASGSTARPSPTAQFTAVRRRDRLRHLRRDRARRRRIIPARCRTCCKAGSLVFTPPTASGRSARLVANGGSSSSARTGGSPTGRAASIKRARRPPGRARRLSRTPRPTRRGPARSCRPKPSGSSPRAAASTAPSSPGATSSRPAAGTWRTPGRATFPHQNLRQRRLRAHLAGRRPSRRTATASTT